MKCGNSCHVHSLILFHPTLTIDKFLRRKTDGDNSGSLKTEQSNFKSTSTKKQKSTGCAVTVTSNMVSLDWRCTCVFPAMVCMWPNIVYSTNNLSLQTKSIEYFPKLFQLNANQCRL